MLPSGPRFGLIETIAFLRKPYDYLAAGFAKWGDPFVVPIMSSKVLVTGHPDGIKDILTAPPDSFAVPSPEISIPVLGPSSVLTMSGPAHRRARKILAPPFHGARMRAYGRTIQEVSRAHAAALTPGVPADAQKLGHAISIDVIMRAVFGIDGEERISVVRDALLGMQSAVKASFLMAKFLQREFFGLSAWSRFMRAKRAVDVIMFEEIGKRRARPEARGEDVLSLLVAARHEDGSALDDDEIRDHLVTMLAAGYETTGTAFAWACDALARHPEVQGRLREEVRAAGDSPEAIAALPYLEAVVNETLRCFPLVATMVRKLVSPITVRGIEVPESMMVGVSMIDAHRRAETWGDPMSFRPERFLDKTWSPFEFFPYGGGHRRCMGAALAHYELKLALGTLLAERTLTLADETPRRPILRGAVISPKGGVPVHLQ
jgi:cytochrome P450